MLATIGLLLTIASIPVYAFTMDNPTLRSTGAVMFGLAAVGVILGFAALKKPGIWRKFALVLNLGLAGLLVYGFFFFTKLPEPTTAMAVKKVADFTLRDQNGAPVSLTALRARGPVHLVFYRGHW